MAGGKPLKFESLEELQSKIKSYFDETEAKRVVLEDGRIIEEPLTITGLALALGTNRQTLINYQKKDEYFDTITLAKTRIENYAEKRLFIGNATGPIFALKNYGWKDKSESEITGRDGAPLVSDMMSKILALLTDEQLAELNKGN